MCTLDSSVHFWAYLAQMWQIFSALYMILVKIFPSVPSVYFRLKYTLDTLGMFFAKNMYNDKKCAHLTQVWIFWHIWPKCAYFLALYMILAKIFTSEPSVYFRLKYTLGIILANNMYNAEKMCTLDPSMHFWAYLAQVCMVFLSLYMILAKIFPSVPSAKKMCTLDPSRHFWAYLAKVCIFFYHYT